MASVVGVSPASKRRRHRRGGARAPAGVGPSAAAAGPPRGPYHVAEEDEDEDDDDDGEAPRGAGAMLQLQQQQQQQREAPRGASMQQQREAPRGASMQQQRETPRGAGAMLATQQQWEAPRGAGAMLQQQQQQREAPRGAGTMPAVQWAAPRAAGAMLAMQQREAPRGAEAMQPRPRVAQPMQRPSPFLTPPTTATTTTNSNNSSRSDVGQRPPAPASSAAFAQRPPNATSALASASFAHRPPAPFSAPPRPHQTHAHQDRAAGHGPASTSTSGISAAFLSEKRWQDADVAALLSPATMSALVDSFRFEFMAKVQAATLAPLLRGEDVFAKAKTGGGKTLGFLIPAVERLVASGRAGRPRAIGVLVIAPTRELALQILEEARTLTAPHAGLRVQAVIGGTNINSEKGRLLVGGGRGVCCDVLVATPGRLVDHIESTPGMVDALGAVSVLVLDEADRLLDMGFEPTLNRIRSVLPAGAPPPSSPGAPRAPGRQTLLFSATVPDAVRSVAMRFLCPGYPMVDTIGAEDTATNPQVTQEALVLPATSVVPALARVLAHVATANPRHKTVVFCTTARLTGYLATLFESMRLLPGGRALTVVEMHSRKSQSARTAAAERFRAGAGLVMFTSDVSARGMDYPGITEVIQVGLTDRESYIHRLGRTARAGREGAGLLLLSEDEAYALLPELADLPIAPAGPASELTGGVAAGLPGVQAAAASALVAPPAGGARPSRAAGAAFLSRFPTASAVVPPAPLAAALADVARDPELLKEAHQAYGAALGFYNGALRRLGWDKPALVANMNALFLTLGCPEVPIMPRDTLGKMGLRGTPGLREGPSLRGGGGGHGHGRS